MQTDIEIQTDRRFFVGDLNSRSNRLNRELNVTMKGMIRVKIGTAFQERDGMHVLPWTVTLMEQSGESGIGVVRAKNNPKFPFYGTVRQAVSDRPFPAELEAAVYEIVTMPGYEELHNISPIIIRGDISAIPPFGVAFPHRTAGVFVDATGAERAILHGRTVTLVGPARGSPTPA
jgi:hypothetical protein